MVCLRTKLLYSLVKNMICNVQTLSDADATVIYNAAPQRGKK